MDVTGTCTLQMDGLSLQSKEGEASLKVGGKSRTPIYVDGGLLGPSEKSVAAEVTATLAHTSQTDMIKLSNAKNVTITFITDTGKRYVIRKAFATEPAELSGSEGDVAVSFMGQTAQDV